MAMVSMDSAAAIPARRYPALPLREGARIVRRHSVRSAATAARPVRHEKAAPAGSSLALQLIPPMALFLTLVFQLWIRVCIIEAGYEFETKRQLAVEKDSEVRKLRSDLAILTTPRALVSRAKKELGMDLPAAANIRKITEGR